MYLAIFETPNFDFHAFGKNQWSAVDKIVKAWEKHAELTGADPDYAERYKEDIVTILVDVEMVYRDLQDFQKVGILPSERF